jgi:hypothetical protein
MSLPSPTKITAAPAPESYPTSGRTNYTYEEALAEFIDNSISARDLGEQLKVVVRVYIEKNVPVKLSVEDNGIGIPEESIPSVIALGKTIGNGSFNEHGMGLKQAAWWMGDSHAITTTTASAQYIVTFSPLNHETTVSYTDKPAGTKSFTKLEIQIRPGSTFIPQETRACKNLLLQLGARYRRFLHSTTGGQPDLILVYETFSKDEGEPDFTQAKSERVSVVSPFYYRAGNDAPFLDRCKVKADDGSWEIELTLGLAPTEEQHDKLGTPPDARPKKGHPYYVGLDKQGLDLMIKGRVLKFHQLSEIGLVPARHNSFNHVRGEINLLSGFKTQRTKNGLLTDSKNWPDMIARVKRIMENEDPKVKIGRNLLARIDDDDLSDVDEAIYQWRIAKMLKKVENWNPKKEPVNAEVQLGQGIDVRSDIVVGETIWEIKKGESTPHDLMQLVMYLTITGYKTGYLVAQSFKASTPALNEVIKSKLGLNIRLHTHADLNIGSHVTTEELDWLEKGGFSNGWSPNFEGPRS